MSRSTTPQAASYRTLLDSLFDPEDGPPGYDRADITAAESRLGRTLPAVLVDHYLAFGRLRFQRAQDRLLAPSAVHVKNGMLIFYEENQQVFHWAVSADASGDDSPVLQSVDDAADEWFEDHDHLSQFFATMLLHHRAFMRPCMSGWATRDALRALDRHALILPGCRRELVQFHRVGNVVVETFDHNEDNGVLVMAGARSEDDLRAFQGNHHFDWT